MTGSATRQSFSRVITARGVRRDDLVAVALPNSAEFVVAYARTRLSAGQLPARMDITRTPLRNQAGKVRRSTFRNPHHRRYTAKV
jgi:hypothetical protein